MCYWKKVTLLKNEKHTQPFAIIVEKPISTPYNVTNISD